MTPAFTLDASDAVSEQAHRQRIDALSFAMHRAELFGQTEELRAASQDRDKLSSALERLLRSQL